MSGAADGLRITLSPDAVRRLEAESGPARASLSSAIDALAAAGLEAADSTAPAPRGLTAARLGDWILWCRPAPDGALLVVTVRRGDSSPEPALRDAVGSLARWGADFRTDLHIALRMLRRRPVFTAMTLAVLTLGIGGSAAIFATARTAFRSPLPFEDAGRLVRLLDHRTAPSGDLLTVNMTPRTFAAIRERSALLSGVVAQSGVDFTLAGEDTPERVGGARVSEGWGEVLGIRPRIGRLFSAEEERAGGAARVALVSTTLWRGALGGDPDVLGRLIELDGSPHRVIGVLPGGFRYPYTADVWVPAVFDRHDGTSHGLNVVARLAPDATRTRTAAELASIARSLESEFPDTNRGFGVTVTSLRENLMGDEDRVVQALVWCVAFLLVIACLDVAALLVSRFLERGHELGVRAALGASHSRQLRQFLTESGLLFGLGGLAGLAAAIAVRRPLALLLPRVLREQTALPTFAVDPALVAWTLGGAVALGLLCGGLASLRTRPPDTSSVLRTGTRAGVSQRGRRLQNALVAAEFALAVPLLVGALVAAGHLGRVTETDLGVDVDRVLTLRVGLEGTGYEEAERRAGLVDRLEIALASIPGVTGAGITTVNPLCCGDWGAQVHIEGLRAPTEGRSLIIHHRLVSPGLHEALGIPLLRGRRFDERDAIGSVPVAIVDERMAARYWPGEDAIGQRVRYLSEGPEAPYREVVGVVGAVEDEGDYTETWYLPYAQSPLLRSSEHLHLMVQTESDPSHLAGAARAAVAEVDPSLAVFGVRSLAETRSDALRQLRFGSSIAASLAAFGAILAMLGIYGVMAAYLAGSLHELRTRLALGASGARIARLVLARGARLVGLGVAIGAVLSLALARAIGSIVPDLGEVPATLVATATLGTLAAGLVVVLPLAARAARVNPAGALDA